MSDGRWSYKWQTSGRLDAGTYTIFAVDRPANRFALSGGSYSTYSVTLGRPSMSAGISGGVSETSVPTETPSEVPTTIATTVATPVLTPTPAPSIWDQISAWFSGLFRVSAADSETYVLTNGEITISGTTIFSTEKEMAIFIEPYFAARPKGSSETFTGWAAVVPVVAGEGSNVWSATARGRLPVGEYIVTIESVGGGQAMSMEINVVA